MIAEAKTTARALHSLAALALGAFLIAGAFGCVNEVSDDPLDVGSEERTAGLPLMSTKVSGISVDAFYRWVLDGVPTYGHEPRAPRLDIEVIVNDAQVAATLPGFDGLESAFVFVPRSDGAGGARWELHGLSWAGGAYRRVGSSPYDQRTELVGDKHVLQGMRLSEADLQQVLARGIAVGLDTNRGTVWAQDADQNFTVDEARDSPR
jgi:hypothetical protein